ncbi:hypothetical protein [Pseudomonas baetica]|uniref:hypothetical protein n=1 Tax=Pseudomonas baetica TaxID=674054 RepID=UPI0024071B87|nr:hypothetical protein [Pseudomonas baetica]MDF9779277.1 hypothetical protein [Pseudomonas baetica]
MSTNATIDRPPKVAGKIKVSSIVGLLCILAYIGWGLLQVYFQFSSDSALWANPLPEPVNTNLNYLVYWARLLTVLGALGLYYCFSWAGGGWGAFYAVLAFAQWVVIMQTDRAQVVQGLAFFAGT